MRERLNNKRPSFAFNFVFEGHRYRASVSRFPDGRLAEIFLDCHKPGTALQANATALARLASLGLQHGISIDDLLTVGGPLAAALELARAP